VWITQPVLPGVNANYTSASVDPARLETHVWMLSETLSPRDARHPENLDRVAVYIRQEFEQAGGVVREQPYEVDGNVYRNGMALFGPETTERIVVGAHYDAVGDSPAADDNASGVAGLIELAHLLGQTSLPMQVELVAYTLEEPPYFRTTGMGSAVHARSLKEQGVPVRVMLALEMIGYFSDAPNSQHFPMSLLSLFYPSQGNFIAIIGKLDQGLLVRGLKKVMRKATSLPVYSINAPGFVPGVDFSDHLNYWQAGYRAVMVTDTAFYRNMNYHSLHDTPDTLDYERMALVVQGVYAAVLAEAA
jgi:Zn-dependent M28 family amino/carboxypeptidase